MYCSKSAPGLLRALTVNVACGEAKLVDPSKVRSGITLRRYVNLSPSPMSMEADSINESMAEPSSS